ncbi:MAG: Pycsar system effector family protein [Pseudomonadota bacterium]
MSSVSQSDGGIDLEVDTDDVIVALRTAQQHQVQLNMLADQKANINIGFTLFFITLSQSQFTLEDSSPELLRIGFVFFIVSIALSLLLALIVVLPRIGKTRINNASEMTNPFYFGMFTQLSQRDYTDYLTGRLSGNESARELLVIDIYQIGQVLNRKYRILRFSYGFLALGVMIAVFLYCYRILAV